MHADGGRSEGVVGRKEKDSPVLTIFVRSFGRAGKDIVPSALRERGLVVMNLSGEGEIGGRTRGY